MVQYKYYYVFIETYVCTFNKNHDLDLKATVTKKACNPAVSLKQIHKKLQLFIDNNLGMLFHLAYQPLILDDSWGHQVHIWSHDWA